jgi:hypothetical protein
MPSIVLASMHGFLQEGATCFPLIAFRNSIPKASDNDVVVHDNVVTSQGIGSTLAFALMLIELLYKNSEMADTVALSMLVDRTKYRYFPPELDPKIRVMRQEELEAQSVETDPFPDVYMPCDMYMPYDDSVLSPPQIMLRKQIEFFLAQQEDIDNFSPNRKEKISIGQVGIRCRHCAKIPRNKLTTTRRCAVLFPATLVPALYQAGQNMLLLHFTDKCNYIDPQLKAQLIASKEKEATRMGRGGKKYWAEMAGARGVYETEKGLRFRAGE